MIEPRGGIPPIQGVPNEALWAVTKELAAVSRAQAKVTQRLIDLIESLPQARGGLDREEDLQDRAGEIREEVREAAGGAPTPEGESIPAAEAPTFTEVEIVVEEVRPAAGNGEGSATLAAHVRGVSPADPLEIPSEPFPMRSGGATEPAIRGAAVQSDGAALPTSPREEQASTGAEPEPLDLVVEGPDEIEESEGGDEMVLTLESGNAPVGVLWDQIYQIGPLTASTVPDRITIDREEIKLVSLGNLLQGVSREEKYFVALEQDGERIGVACEKMLGLGPLSGTEKTAGGPRIQVLNVPFLQTFAASKRIGEKIDPPVMTQTPEDLDRRGPLRALVAVRYLPARIDICRHVRGRGWQVGEAAGLEEATVSLDLGRWDALFLEEGRSNGEADEAEATLLRRVVERRVAVVRVGSRITGYPPDGDLSLMFPFTEAELDAILVRIGRRAPA